MKIPVTFYSYFKDLAGTPRCEFEIAECTSIADLMECIFKDYPKLKSMERAILIAVGVEYQTREYKLQPGDEVSLFPPVQGGSL